MPVMAETSHATVHPLPPPRRGRDKTAAERQRRYRDRKKEPVDVDTAAHYGGRHALGTRDGAGCYA
jgi:hypothetical protein